MKNIVSCSGIKGSNAQAACKELMPECEIMYLDSFAAVFEAVADEKCNFGVVPIENSFNGTVRAVYELMLEYKFLIAKSLLLPIHHNLLAKRGVKLEEVEQIYSHPQALGQCSEFLNNLHAKTIPYWNTAAAAEMVSKSSEKNIAAVASPLCEELYGLESLARDIQDNSRNYTRFIAVSKTHQEHERADHMSLIVGCENSVGALSKILSVIASHNINMNKIESCPIADRAFEYMFFLELEASLNDYGVKEMLKEIEARSQKFIFLGNYEQLGKI